MNERMESSQDQEIVGVPCLRHVTAKQLQAMDISNLSSSILHCEGAQITGVILVGWISSMRETEQLKSFVLDDGTGEVNCVLWSNTGPSRHFIEEVQPGSLLKVAGVLKALETKLSIQCTYAQKVEDGNYLCYHLLQCISEHRENKAAQAASQACGETSTFATSFIENRDPESEFSQIHRDVLKCYEKNQEDTGLSKKKAARMLAAKYSEHEVSAAIDFLVDGDRLVYSSSEELILSDSKYI